MQTEPEKKEAVRALLEKGIIIKMSQAKRNVGDAYIKMLRLSEDFLTGNSAAKLTPKQKSIVGLLEENGSASVKEACYICNVTAAVVKNLIKNGVVEEFEYEVLRVPDAGDCKKENAKDIILSDAQQKVFGEVSSRMDGNEPQCFLLHGITGSGKTSVFIRLIDKALDDGKNAIMLIPEIALTPQVVDTFQRLFGAVVAVIHSNLSLSQRLDEYKRIRRGQVRIVIGTRSAVFAPLKNIGIIVMDEEGERSYKSDSSPRYSTASVARLRCKTHNAVLLLASATPSIESYYYAQKGVYRLLELKERFYSGALPNVNIIDMNEERNSGNTSEFSYTLINELDANLKNGEQSILLLNRRGYHTIISCCDCREPVYCPNCSVPLTYHKVNGSMMCHYCGYSAPLISECPHCKSTNIKQTGFGTQKMQEELQELFPQARILRMDADTTFSRYAYEKSFREFGEGKYDIMLGTQMIGKGLDFPNVTLVGVLSIDKALFAGDFRSYERTFSLITQVVGRSGRGDKAGRALLQTFVPEHYIIGLAAQQNYRGFYDEEIALRRALIFPPFCDICVLGISSANDEKTAAAADIMLKIIRDRIKADNIKIPLRVLGPAQYAYGKLNGKYRYRIIIKCKNNSELREFIGNILTDTSKYREFSGISVFADINGEIGI